MADMDTKNLRRTSAPATSMSEVPWLSQIIETRDELTGMLRDVGARLRQTGFPAAPDEFSVLMRLAAASLCDRIEEKINHRITAKFRPIANGHGIYDVLEMEFRKRKRFDTTSAILMTRLLNDDDEAPAIQKSSLREWDTVCADLQRRLPGMHSARTQKSYYFSNILIVSFLHRALDNLSVFDGHSSAQIIEKARDNALQSLNRQGQTLFNNFFRPELTPTRFTFFFADSTPP